MKVSLNWLRDYVEINCDPDELGLRLTKAGFNLEQIVSLSGDTVLDLEVTSNRPDCLAHIGIAREIATLLEKPLRLPEPQLPQGAAGVADLATVNVRSPELCPRYTARVVRSVKIAPSPDWLVRRLEALGLRSVNNVVDVTNYVLLETGQPLHAFDYDKLAGHHIAVRPAQSGETIVAIDGSEHRLGACNLVIADADRPVAVAGVMGGLKTEVSEQTTTLLLESAQFDPLSVRRTARQLNLHSESSYRFERGVDPVGVEWASRRAAQLICELAGGTVAPGLIDVWAHAYQPQQILLPAAQIKRVLGIDIPTETVEGILSRLGFKVLTKDGAFNVTTLSHRSDVTRPIDLIEEIGRIRGYDHVPTRGTIEIAAQRKTKREVVIAKVSEAMNQCGFYEAMTVSLVEPEAAALFIDFDPSEVLTVTDHQRRANNVLRPSLLPSLLAAARHNQNVGNVLCELYELARVYLPQPGETLPAQQVHLAALSTRELRSVRGTIEEVLSVFRRERDLRFEPVAESKWFLPDQSARIYLGDKPLGLAGTINPQIQKQFDLRTPLAVAEINFDLLLALPLEPATYQPLPRYPAIERDLSIIVGEHIRWETIEKTIRSLKINELEAVEFGELFRGKQISAGRKSIFLTMRFRHPERSLTHDQVDAYQQQIIAALTQSCQAELRS
jgi:phenylalanyl-tRNA synthetase beta chain